MPHVTWVDNNYSAGETSPTSVGNPAIREYRHGSRVFENAIPSPGGRGYFRRPGTYYRAAIADNKVTRLFRVQGNAATYSRILQFDDTTIRWWNTSTYAQTANGASAWTAAQLPYMRAVSIGGRLIAICRATTRRGGGQTRPKSITTAGAISNFDTTGIAFHSSAGVYPGIIGQSKGRLILGATANRPEQVAGSRSFDSAGQVDRYSDFTVGTASDHAFDVSASDEDNSGLQWVASHRRILVGGDKTVFAGPGGVVNAATFAMDDELGEPSVGALACRLNGGVVFVGGPAPRGKLLVYSEEGGGVVCIDIGWSADHILRGGCTFITATSLPWPIVWFGRADGTLVSCSIEAGGGSATWGWARHNLGGDGLVEDGVGIHKGQTTGDELWLVVNRGGTRTIETMLLPSDIGNEVYDQTNADRPVHYVDSGLRLAPASATVTGLSHLEGQTVQAVADGGAMPEEVVAGGEVTYDASVTNIHIGLGYTMTVLPNRPEISVNGTWQAKTKLVEKVILRIHNTMGGKVGQTLSSLEAIPYFTPDVQVLGDPPDAFTGDIEIGGERYMTTDGSFYMVQDDPFPFTLLAAYSKIAVEER